MNSDWFDKVVKHLRDCDYLVTSTMPTKVQMGDNFMVMGETKISFIKRGYSFTITTLLPGEIEAALTVNAVDLNYGATLPISKDPDVMAPYLSDLADRFIDEQEQEIIRNALKKGEFGKGVAKLVHRSLESFVSVREREQVHGAKVRWVGASPGAFRDPKAAGLMMKIELPQIAAVSLIFDVKSALITSEFGNFRSNWRRLVSWDIADPGLDMDAIREKVRIICEEAWALTEDVYGVILCAADEISEITQEKGDG